MSNKLKSLDELRKLRDQAAKNTKMRETGEDERIVIAVGMATCGIAAGARVTMSAIRDEVDKNNLDNVNIVATGCFGYCYAEPPVELRMPGQDPIRYGNVDEERAREIIEKHIMRGELLDNAIVGREVPHA